MSYRHNLCIPTPLETFIATAHNTAQFCTGFFRITVIPTGIYMNGIAYIFSFYRIIGKPSITGLIGQSGYPDYISGFIGTNFVYDSLKIQIHILKMPISTTGIRSIRSFYMNGFIRQFKHDIAIVLQLGMLRYNIPYL